MDYTDKQYEIIELLEAGLIFDEQSHEIKEILCYLQDQGIANPKAYIADGYYELSEDGKRILEDHRRKLRAAKIETQRQLQELRRREEEKHLARQEQQLKESKEALKMARDEAKQEKQQRFENKIAIANLLIPLITFILGLVAEHYSGMLEFFLKLFD